ncbi:MAG: chitobiase/beta-hexosaminidase C-terminal domain-containing protein [Bacteroidales bacterium]|nr:chitobiase/beta-hexosaminidase C-terminal domain-containing protein [Bacteroidales bacterium]
MKKNYVLKIMMAVMLTMLLTVGNVFADKGWVQVTYTSNLSVGDTIIIAAADFDKAIGEQKSNNRNAVDIVKSGDGGMLVSIGSARIFVLHAGNVEGTFAFFDPNQGPNGGYLYAAGGATSGNYLKTEESLDEEGRGYWSLSFTDDGAIDEIVAQTTATERVFMRYNTNPPTQQYPNNTPLFSCYTSNSSINNHVTIYRYEEVEAATVAQPEFSVPQGVYYEPQTVSITCATTGAAILYTIDGSDPVSNGSEYTAPLTISTTTTVKAVAYVGTDFSMPNQVTYTIPVMNNIAAFKALHSDNTSSSINNDNTIYFLNEDVTFVFRNGRNMYVKDATAGLLIYDNSTPVITSEYAEGDVIPGGLYGKYSRYNNQVELVPDENPAVSTENTGAVQPIVVTMADLLANYDVYDAQLITLENVTFPDGFTGATQTTIEQDNHSMVLYKRFPLDATLDANAVANVTGFAGRYNNTIQIYPRYNADLSTAPQPSMPSLTVTGIADGDELSTFDTLRVNFHIENFTLTNIMGIGGDGYLKLESQLFETVGLDNPTYLNATTLPYFTGFTPIPEGIHTVTASLVGLDSAALSPAVSQSVTFTVTPVPAAAPAFEWPAGTYADSVVVTLSCETQGAQIRYTLAGEEPNENSYLYEEPFTLYSSRTVKAKAFMTNSLYWADSPVAEAAYTIVSAPTMLVEPANLAFGPNQTTSTVYIYSAALTDPITISCDNTDFQLSETTFPANVGNTSFTVTYTGFGPAFGMVTVSSGTLSSTIDLVATAQLPAPEFSPASGTVDTLIAVVMTDDVQGAGISYTIDGTDPDETSPVYTPGYSEPIVFDVPGTYTVKAFAFLEGWGNSEIATATYTVVAPIVPDIDTIIYTVGFESSEGFTVHEEMIGGSPAAVYNNTEIYYSGAENHQWGTFYGTPSTNAAICGEQSMQMRWYTANPDRLGYTFTNFDMRNVTYVTFDAKQTSGNKLKVSYSIDGGNTYVGDSLYALTTNRHNYRFNVSETGEYNFVRLRFDFVLTDGTPVNKSKVVIDSVVVFGVPGIEVNMVETPVISPNSGAYHQPFDATITCATDGAVIRYTTDGTEPTESSAVYSSAVIINGTTTLKAKAWKNGMEASMVATATYTFPTEVLNIAAFKAEGANGTNNNTEYKITGDVIFVFRSGKYMLVEDESAALMIFDNNTSVITSTYNEGDVISGGVFGKFNLYHGMVEMVPTLNTEASTSNTGAVTPMVQTIPVLLSQYSTYESRLVIIENVTFIGDKKFVNGTDTLAYYDNFGTIENEPEVGETGSITGFLGIYDNKVRVYPRDDNDFNISPVVVDQVATPTFAPAAGEYENSVEVSISCTTEDATIYYTLDGTEPDANATEYTAPFTLTATATVKAIALKEGMTNSEVAEATYTVTTVGIHNLQQTVSIYPNPTTGNVTLDLSGMSVKTVELFSMSGQMLNTVVPNDETMILSLSQYANGIYFVRIYSDKSVTTQKIVKK